MSLTPAVTAFANRLDNVEADDLLVELASEAMQDKLAKKRRDGRGGWHTTDASNADLMESLKAHVAKGDMVDVMNLAAMIFVRLNLYGRSA